jgi:threonylcarbamoyladenosine tRNA methylthiotransferase MtaB
VQSGDDAVLARMGRRYTAAQVRETLEAAAARLPGIGLGADFICGFPGEDEPAFARTLELCRDIPLSNLHVFPYSERPGTPAAGYGGRVPPAARKRRAQQLIAWGEASRESFARRFVGRPVTVLVERVDREGVASGWSGEYLACRVRGVAPERRRQLVTFTPDAAEGGTLAGEALRRRGAGAGSGDPRADASDASERVSTVRP